MRKRTIFAVLITITFIFLSKDFWLIFRPLNVSFDVSGKDKCRIDVLFNKKDNDRFTKVRNEEKEVDLLAEDKVSFNINVKFPKRLRIVIKDAKSPVEISNIELRNGKIKIDDLENFSSNTEISIKDNKIIIEPSLQNAELTYNKTLKLRAPLKFDFLTLIAIAILSFLFSYKISDYIADFSSIKEKSRVDIFFLVVFFVFLFIPMMFIDKREISIRENRRLSEFKSFINEDNTINYNFGNDFNSWFNDRFGLRKALISFHKSVMCLFLIQPKNGLIDRDTHFLYVDYELFFTDINIIKEYFEGYFALKKWAKDNKIKLYILIVPNKTSIYQPKNLKISSYHNDFINYVSQLNDNHIIYPYKELLDNKKDYTFFKTEHHWTDYGAFVGYQALMKEINKDYPKIKILNENDFDYFYNKQVRGDFTRSFNYGTSVAYLGMPSKAQEKYHQTDYRYFKHKDFNNLKVKVIDENFHKGKIYYYPKGADLRVVQLGTSQNENLDEFLPFTFKYVKRIRNNNVKGVSADNEYKIMKYYEKEILDYKPDILIYCLTYWNLYGLKNTFNKD